MKILNESLKVSFYLKKKDNRKGFCPVMGRITIGKDIVQFSCKLEANSGLWDTRAGRMNGKSHHAREVNCEIDKINVLAHARYTEIVSLRGQAAANEVKNAFQGISSVQDTLLKVFREHNDDYKNRVGVNRSRDAYLQYKYSYDSLQAFINQKYHVCDVSFRALDYSFIEYFDRYLRINCKLMPKTIMQRIICLRKMIKIAIGRGIIRSNPFNGYSSEKPVTGQKFIPFDDLEKLMNIPLKSRALNATRDMFVFSCYTGLSFIDMHHLTYRQIVRADDGSVRVNMNRQKTGNVSKIPLLEIPLQLIEKYRDTSVNGKVFPMKDNKTMNIQLNKTAKQCGIERRLTFHMARHTFATEICLSQRVPIETVSQMMGHKKLSTTQIYAKVTHGKLDEDMDILSEKLNGKYILAY
jgi:site-specific recombinase XerD